MRPPLSRGARSKPRFYGKYRGVVIDNIDPMQIGRIQAQVPDALGEAPSDWALPCAPAAGVQAGVFIVPPVGSQVWVEFERGDLNFPVWTGGFWGVAPDVPALAISPPPIPSGQTIVLQTTGRNALALSDALPGSGGIMLKAAGGATIVVNDAGVIISNGKGATVSLIGPAVTVNSGALTVAGATVLVDGVPIPASA